MDRSDNAPSPTSPSTNSKPQVLPWDNSLAVLPDPLGLVKYNVAVALSLHSSGLRKNRACCPLSRSKLHMRTIWKHHFQSQDLIDAKPENSIKPDTETSTLQPAS